MITCYLNYKIDPKKLKEFEYYAKLWIPLVNKFGGTHHGYFLPSEDANNVALALFTFPLCQIKQKKIPKLISRYLKLIYKKKCNSSWSSCSFSICSIITTLILAISHRFWNQKWFWSMAKYMPEETRQSFD